MIMLKVVKFTFSILDIETLFPFTEHDAVDDITPQASSKVNSPPLQDNSAEEVEKS
jgi:hypothetical protein